MPKWLPNNLETSSEWPLNNNDICLWPSNYHHKRPQDVPHVCHCDARPCSCCSHTHLWISICICWGFFFFFIDCNRVIGLHFCKYVCACVCVCVCVCVLPAPFSWKLSLSLSNRIGRTPAANAACCHQVVHLKQHWSDCRSLLENGARKGRAETPTHQHDQNHHIHTQSLRYSSFHWLNAGKRFSFYLVSTLISHR